MFWDWIGVGRVVVGAEGGYGYQHVRAGWGWRDSQAHGSGVGAKDLTQEDLYIVSVLQNRATSPGYGNLSNGQDSSSIDNQAKYAGNPNSIQYSYPNVSDLIAKKLNLPANSADCQSFLNDISTAQGAIQQVLTSGSVSSSVFFWYTKGFNTSSFSWVGPVITTINNTTFYGHN